MTNEELNNLQAEAYDHLWNGRHRMALVAAEKLFQFRPYDSEASICLAWAYLENGQPTKAMEYANLAVELKGDLAKTRFFRAYILTRMSIFEGAVADIDKVLGKEKNLIGWTYLNKARALAGLKQFDEANKAFSYGLLIHGGENKEWENARKWFQKAAVVFTDDYKFNSDNAPSLLEDAREAIKSKEFWYALFTAQKINNDAKLKKAYPEAEVIELEAMYNLFQYSPALKKAEAMKHRFHKNEKFNAIHNALLKFIQKEQAEIDKEKSALNFDSENNTLSTSVQNNSLITNFRLDSIFYPNDFADVFSIKIYDASHESKSSSKKYYKQINQNILFAGVEIIFNNPLFGISHANYNCSTVWYLNDYEVGKNNFKLNVPADWDSVIFSQTLGSDKENFWKNGQAKVEFYINKFKVAERYFGVDSNEIEEKEYSPLPLMQKKELSEEPDIKTKSKNEVDQRSLDDLLRELDSFIGLSSIKQSVRDFITFLEFIKERKKFGLKADDKISINAVFLGNPGTGKTTIARLLGSILKSMGIIKYGHVVEVDRAGLVGQYIGETAQKTEKIISDSIGGVLFIDEAYSLVKKGGTGQDFGQEAIDVLLKRMEDRKGEFVVIVAGYPDEMNNFIQSNPGIKSRFNHTFTFEDYTPDELIKILERNLTNEEYSITTEAKELLLKEFIKIYRGRDKFFGNARIVRNIFEQSKINLGKRVISLGEEKRSKEILNTITVDDISSLITKPETKHYKISINEELLKECLAELNSLVGLASVKKEINDLVKLARFFAEQGENLSDKFNSHYLFLGNPGTGKTTVARLFSKIFSALGILTKGHLIETDRQGLVAGYVGQTAEKTTMAIEKSFGGTLFIDEAYSLVKSDGTNDFGKEAIDIILKRMEDDRGKFIIIAAGYTEEMKNFISSNPGIQSRFQKSFTFEDYSPYEMLEIAVRQLTKEKKKITPDAQNLLAEHFSDIHKTRDKKFGNARIVRNLVEAAKQKLLLRIADIPQQDRTDEIINTITKDDINLVLNIGTEARDYEVFGDPLILQEYIDELNSLTGIDNIKQGIYKLISGLKINQIRKERGLQVLDKNFHAVFMGNPGTGKRTVAKIFSKILKELGVLEKGHLVEVDRSDLVAGYQGQTSIKTERKIQEVIGGTLFINDAYSLLKDNDEFGREAIETLTKKMEELKGKFVVIASGPSSEMHYFLESITGSNRIFNSVFEFDDYSPRQLLAIAYDIAESNGYFLDEGALQILLELFNDIYAKRDNNFANAREARNILYSAISCQEERISEIINPTDEDLKTIVLEDVQSIKF